MNSNKLPAGETVPLTLPYRPGVSKHDRVSLASDLLPPVDFICFLFAGSIATLLYSLLVATAPLDASVAVDRVNVALIGAVLAPFVLYDRNFAAAVGRRRMIGMFGLRFLSIATIAVAIGAGSQVFENLPPSWVVLWLGVSAALTASVRVIVATKVRSLDRGGAFNESVAIVGAELVDAAHGPCGAVGYDKRQIGEAAWQIGARVGLYLNVLRATSEFSSGVSRDLSSDAVGASYGLGRRMRLSLEIERREQISAQSPALNYRETVASLILTFTR